MRSAVISLAADGQAGPAAPPGGLTILVVDDSPSIVMSIRGFLSSQGHRVVAAEDGESALRIVRAARPDLVLMDVVMPEPDGIEITRRLRAEAAGNWFPIILMSSLDGANDVVRGLHAGADDYLTKPVHLGVLNAKITSFQRIITMQRELVTQASALRQLQDEQAYEHELAASLIQNIVQREGLNEPSLRWQMLPSARFSGDVVAAARSPDGRLYTVLGDATGHGLAASVSLIPALQVFYGMVRKGLPLAELVREMNVRLREQLPVGRYFAATLVVLDERSRQLEYWNGGMPPAFLQSASRSIRAELSSSHVALGILPDDRFEDDCSHTQWHPGEVLVLYSDGVIEAMNGAGEPFGMDRLRDSLESSRGGRPVDAVMAALHAHVGSNAAQDDASILAINLL